MAVLTRVERLILLNQNKILSLLSPDEAESRRSHEQILVEGLELEYERLLGAVYDEVFPAASCTEVIDILEMYESMQVSVNSLTNKAGLSDSVGFPGFDGNNEAAHMTYARFLREDGRFAHVELQCRDDLNSHFPTLDRYRAMLKVWKALPNRRSLNATEINSILSATDG